MAMNHRLLRPLASQSLADADAAAYLAAVEAADGQSLEPAVRNAITAFVVGCKSDGIWDAIKRSCILMGARTLSGALVPLAGAAPTNVNFVSGDYNRKTGLIGNASTKYLETGYDNIGEGQDDFHGSVYASSIGTGPNITQFFFGAGAASNGDTIFGSLDITGTSLFCRSRSGSSDTVTSRHGVGFMGMSRSNASNYIVRGQSGNTTVTRTSQTPLANTFWVFARSSSPGPTNARLSFYSLGSHVDLALLDARVSALYASIGNAIP